MKVLYNATSVRVGGGLSYSRAQVMALAEVGDIELTVLTAPWNHGSIEEAVPATIKIVQTGVRTVPWRFAWEQTVLPTMARRHDVLVSPGNFGAMVCGTPQVVILQNANYVGAGRRLDQNQSFRRRVKIAISHASLRRAHLVVAISDSLADEIGQEPKLTGINLTTVKSGAPSSNPMGADPSREVIESIDRMVGSGPYYLSVANDYPHKRLDDLARLPGFAAHQGLSPSIRLIFAGDISARRCGELSELAGVHRDLLVFVGPISNRAMVLELYRRAVATISCSQLEAFPLVLHEALSQGCPLVVSDIPPHRELADGQAEFFAVGDLSGLTSALKTALERPRPEPGLQPWTWSDHGQQLAAQLRLLIGA